MKQPTKDIINEKIEQFLLKRMTREDISEWAMNFIRNDGEIEITDIDAWHFLVAISNIDEMISTNEYLYDKGDIRELVNKYI